MHEADRSILTPCQTSFLIDSLSNSVHDLPGGSEKTAVFLGGMKPGLV